MHHFAFETVESNDIWVFGYIQLSNSRDEEGRCDGIIFAEFSVFASQACNLGAPCTSFFIPSRFFDGGVEADVFVELVLLGDLD